jgi:general stress protein 26
MTEESKIGTFTKSQVDAFLAHPYLARLATAVPAREDPAHAQPHNVPVWFLWDGQSIWISAFQSTRKGKEVKRNPRIAVLIDVEQAVGGVSAVLMEGKAEIVLEPATVQEMSRRIYTHYMGEEGVKAPDPQSWIVDPDNSIIKLTPSKIFTW